MVCFSKKILIFFWVIETLFFLSLVLFSFLKSICVQSCIQKPVEYLYVIYRSSHPEVFCKKGVPRNFAKFTRKYLYQSIFYERCRLEACNFIKKQIRHKCFSVDFAKFLRTPLFAEHLQWLLLYLLLQKRFIVDARLGSKYAYGVDKNIETLQLLGPLDNVRCFS